VDSGFSSSPKISQNKFGGFDASPPYPSSSFVSPSAAAGIVPGDQPGNHPNSSENYSRWQERKDPHGNPSFCMQKVYHIEK